MSDQQPHDNVISIYQPPPYPTSHVAHALSYARLGWHVFPVYSVNAQTGLCTCNLGATCKNPGKHPLSFMVPRGQEDASTDETKIKDWWRGFPTANIGIHMARSRLVAIDIDPRNNGWDTIDQVEAKNGPLMSDVMAFTGGGGEHRIFSISEDLSVNLPGKLGPGVDIKRNGYIVAPPSNHASGNKYEWEASSDPLEGIMPTPAPDWLLALGTAPASDPSAARGPIAYTPIDGLKQSEIREALEFISAQNRDTWLNIGMALHSTAGGPDAFALWDTWSQSCPEKYNPVHQTRTWISFRNKGLDGITIATLFGLAKEGGYKAASHPSEPALQPRVITEADIFPPEDHTIPQSLLNPPGKLGDFFLWSEANSTKTQPQFSVQAAIAFFSVVFGRRFVTDRKNWPTLYTLIIAKSGTGKEHAKESIDEALLACNLAHLIGPAGFTSDSAIVSALIQKPSHISVIDEFGKVIADISSPRAAAHSKSMVRMLMEVWGRCNGLLVPKGLSTMGMSPADASKFAAKSILKPSLTLLGMTTPDAFYSGLSSTVIKDGFLNRFLIVESNRGREKSLSKASVAFPESLALWVKDLRAKHDRIANPDLTPNIDPNAAVIPFSQPAINLFDKFEDECLQMMANYERYDLDDMFVRTREIGMRLSLIVAICCDETEISAASAQWAIDYVRFYAIQTVTAILTKMSGTDFGRQKLQIVAFIKKAGFSGVTEGKVRDYCRYWMRGLDPRVQRMLFDGIVLDGDVAIIQPEGKRGLRYVAIKYREDDQDDVS